ncbi:MAG: GGDEF domain-containing protein [Kiritimatiellaeota bacterium]|nr:GGDEF domain-containing protein [Kiritimatiellota bacterium]
MSATQTLATQRLYDESEVGRMEQLLSGRAPTLGQVSAYAGDRPLTDEEHAFFAELQQKRGELFFPDLLYAITHQIFSPAIAGDLWGAILRHKYELSETLKRNLRITVAALDYLTNLRGELHSATLIAEAHMTDMVRLTQHDGLTNLFNHASFYQKLEHELRCYARCQRSVAVMMLDVDHFKEINDRFGHPVGDLVLVDLGAFIQGAVRASDVCCRYGGEEFAVILPNTGAAEAGVLADRLCLQLTQQRPGEQSITISIGVAACGTDTNTAHALVNKADTALYAAKHGGRNRVVVDNT